MDLSQSWQTTLQPLASEAPVHATLILSELSARADRAFLGMPVALRVALSLAQAGVTELSVYDPRARVLSLLEQLRADSRLRLPLREHAPDVPIDVVCHEDAWIAPERVRELGLGEAVLDARGEPALLRVRPTCAEDPLALLVSAADSGKRQPGALRLRHADDQREASRQLFAALIKPSDGPVSRHLNRHVSRAITRLVLPLGMTPNTMTVFVALTGLAGAYCASFPSPALQLLGAALYQFHSIIDGCDGEIARLTQRFGKHGALIDSVVDDVCNAAFFFGLSLGVARLYESSWPLATGTLTAVAYAGVIALQYGVVLHATGRGDKTKFWAPPSAERPSVFGVFKALLRRDVFVLLILIAVALGLQQAAVALFPLAALGALVASSVRLMQSKGTA